MILSQNQAAAEAISQRLESLAENEAGLTARIEAHASAHASLLQDQSELLLLNGQSTRRSSR